MLCQHDYKLSQRLSEELIWNRFFNVHGLPGRNIPADLHMEHMNQICKEAISGLGINKTDKATVHVGKCIGRVCPVLDQYDSENSVPESTNIRGAQGQNETEG